MTREFSANHFHSKNHFLQVSRILSQLPRQSSPLNGQRPIVTNRGHCYHLFGCSDLDERLSFNTP